MNVTTTWHGDNFNVDIASAAGKEAFLSIKGCRIVDGQKGPFVSYPAKKNEQTGKWWNHVWASEQFNAVVLSKALESQPKQASRARPASGGGGGAEDDIPFANPLAGRKALAL